ncbi:MAG: HAD family hydrolase [Rhodospirillales bacterium]|jgi:D-glycero-D-manno-heptose 1,7-bisphosphate phosphatase|nr:HAD family hydrolase [Rhodospirillales bacterium]
MTVREDGMWAQVTGSGYDTSKTRPALFLDRDGVINEDVGYLHEPAELQLIPQAAETIAQANALGIAVIVVTNQGGIGLDYFGWPEFVAVQQSMAAQLTEAAQARIDGIFASPYHPRGTGIYAHPDHPSRKPNPGMLLTAAEMLNLDLSGSWIVGDHWRDLEAGKNAGLAGGMHVLTGHGLHDDQREQAIALGDNDFQVISAQSIAAAEAQIPLFRA